MTVFAGRDDAPAMRLTDTDSATDYLIGAPDQARHIQGACPALLAWLLGRSDGAELGRRLPQPSFLY